MKFLRAAGMISLLGLAACGGFRSPLGSSPSGVPPLQPAPTTPVESMQLPPPPGMEEPQQPVDEAAAAAQLQEAQQSAVAIAKPDLAGAWTISSGGETCKLFMNLTSWTGGYRANTRGCASEELKSIGAWDLGGKEVTLKDSSGSPVARLYASAPQRYSGQLEVSKRGVQVFR